MTTRSYPTLEEVLERERTDNDGDTVMDHEEGSLDDDTSVWQDLTEEQDSAQPKPSMF